MRQRSLARSTSCVKLTLSGSVESQYLVGSASPSGHSISNHSGDSFSGISLLYPTPTRTRAKREDSQSAEPSRHFTTWQAGFAAPAYLLQRDLRFGLELDLLRHARLLPPCTILGPGRRQVQPIGD